MIQRAEEFKAWAQDIRDRFEDQFGFRPSGAPNLAQLSCELHERMMRLGVEARFFGAEERDDLAVMAHHTLLRDDLRIQGRTNHQENLYGYQEKHGLLTSCS